MGMNTSDTATSPLSRVGASIPARVATVLSVGGRVGAAAVALLVALDQTYRPTEAFAPAIAILILLSAVPVPGRTGMWLAGLGASLAFFGGAVLFNVWIGWLMVPFGVVAIVGVFAKAYHRGENMFLMAIALAAGPPIIGVLVAAVVLGVDG
jgi:hypothetical protein